MKSDFTVETKGRGLVEITGQLRQICRDSPADSDLCHVFIGHTSASLIVCENADPSVLRDLEAFTGRWVPDGADYFEHTAEGPDDMSAHIRSVFTNTSLTLPIREGWLALGTWQGVFVWEHRSRPHRRSILVTIH